MFARLYDRLNEKAEKNLFPEHREYLASDLHGSVLELGVGTGAMFSYYEVGETDEDFELHGIEPDPYMRCQAEERAEELGLSIELVDAEAEFLPYPDESFDVVIASLVLCTVRDVERTLEEIERVLKPDGEFRFFEHVQADGRRGTVEEIFSRYWRPLVAGCHIDRNTDEQIRQRFRISDTKTMDIGNMHTFPVKRFVRGCAHPN